MKIELAYLWLSVTDRLAPLLYWRARRENRNRLYRKLVEGVTEL